jgi:GT2 family glycosyltransferase
MSGNGGVRTSVVVPAYESWQTLPQTLEALRGQVERPDRELILVESSGRSSVEELERRWPWVTAVAPPSRALPGTARNMGAERARGELLAFTDADAVPEAGWLDALEHALGPGIDAVAGAIVNGTPRSAVGTSDYLLEFAAWLPGRSGSPLHGATCNLLVRREALERAGGFAIDLWPGEDTVFTFRLGEAGRLAFAEEARVRHLNRTRFNELLRHQYVLGSSFSRVCREVNFPHREFSRLPLSLVAGPLRLPVLLFRLARWRQLRSARPSLLPFALVASCAWSTGLTVGAARQLSGRRARRR